MVINIRRQLTLFLEQKDAEMIENIRQKFNPKQSELINAHVTLCREDEIQNLEKLKSNLLSLTFPNFDIEFRKITRFDEGKGLLLPAIANNKAFDNLRKEVLKGLIDCPRKHEPHITLMHPRNSTCSDDIFKQLEKLNLPTKLNFKKISLIEQRDQGKWTILLERNLANKM